MPNGWYQLENNRPRKGASPGFGGPSRRPAPVPPPAPTPPPGPEGQKAAPPAPVPPPAPEPEWERADAALEPGAEGLHSQTIGPGGPVVLQDVVLHETLERFVEETPRERAVHVKGWGAMGYFVCTHPMGEHTMLPFLQREGVRVPTATRFSPAVGARGTPDAARNVWGCATKFYTEEGIFDLLCNHIPVFSVRDAMRFPEFIRALRPSPENNLTDPGRFWSFVADAPESIHFVTWLYSDIGTVKSLCHLRSYGVNTYVWRNASGRRTYVKYHWLPSSGAEWITAEESDALAGDPDVAGRELWQSIERGTYPQYELRVQLMDPEEGRRLPYDPLDSTKVWSEESHPLLPVGRLTLNKNPERYWEQVEKLAFSPTNLLCGAELSDDKLLQGRATIYWDAQRRRLGENFRSIPVNRQTNWRPEDLVSSGLGTEVCGVQAREEMGKQDSFTQAGERYRAFRDEERAHLTANLARALSGVEDRVRETVLEYLRRADEAYGEQVAQKLRQTLEE